MKLMVTLKFHLWNSEIPRKDSYKNTLKINTQKKKCCVKVLFIAVTENVYRLH